MSLLLGIELAAFLIGLLFGSFLNVCIARLPEHRSLSRPRSHCPQCKATIRWYDNVPVLSWVLLRGRCRSCNAPISWRYPAVELAVGLWFGLVTLFGFAQFSGNGTLALSGSAEAQLLIASLGCAVLGFLLLGLLVMDWRTHTLPDAFTVVGIVIGFVLICCQAVFLRAHDGELLLQGRNPLSSPGNVVDRGNVVLTGPEHLVLGRLLAVCAAAGLLLLVRFVYQTLRRREGLGLGDVKLLAMIAAFLGFWPAMLALFLGVVCCAGFALVLLARGRGTAATRLPLGTFLCLGGLVAALAGPVILTWYSHYL